MPKFFVCLALVTMLHACSAEPPSSDAHTAAPAVLVVTIEGMHCAACAASITATMNRCDGIQTAVVSFEEGQATIVGNNSAALEHAVQSAQALGFTIEPAASDAH